jgi:hypothetical protein
MTPPFFITGPGRSGTTLLRAILDARPDVRIPGETHFYTTYRIENLARFHFLTRGNYLKAVRRYPAWRHVCYEQLDWARFTEIAQAMPAERASILRAYLQACAEAAGATRLGEKTPGHIRTLGRIWRDFPEARVIHVMRDPRAVAASYLGHDLYARVFGADVTRAALKWLEAARIHRRVQADPRYMLLRYEDLVAAPEASLARVQDFLGMTPDPDLLTRYEKARLVLPDNPNHQNINRPLTSAGLDSWRRKLPATDQALIDAFAGPYLPDFGYLPSGNGPASTTQALARRIAFWRNFARYGLGRVGRSLLGRVA